MTFSLGCEDGEYHIHTMFITCCEYNENIIFTLYSLYNESDVNVIHHHIHVTFDHVRHRWNVIFNMHFAWVVKDSEYHIHNYVHYVVNIIKYHIHFIFTAGMKLTFTLYSLYSVKYVIHSMHLYIVNVMKIPFSQSFHFT